jgi:glycerophosphoryl diester phosphodiesterase
LNKLAFLIALASHSTMAFDLQGHRGTRGHLPENTLPGFARAVEMGVDTLEMDVGVTRDGVVVIHHDRRLNPDVARKDGKWVQAPAALIHELNFSELQRYDVGRIRPNSEYAARFPRQKPIDGTPIPRLADLFASMKGHTVRFNIETKLAPDAPGETLPPEPFARALIAEVRKAGMQKRTTIQSFDFRTLKVVEKEAPEIATSYLTDGQSSDPARVREAGARLWSPNFRDLDAAKVARARSLGLRIVAWTVNEPDEIRRVLGLKLDGLISDYPDRVRPLLK